MPRARPVQASELAETEPVLVSCQPVTFAKPWSLNQLNSRMIGIDTIQYVYQAAMQERTWGINIGERFALNFVKDQQVP
jgi:hypothetical protein